jgi:hypothetical protein
MRLFIFTILLITNAPILQSQTTESKRPLLSSVSFSLINEANALTGIGFDNLNTIFQQNNIYALKPVLASRALELRFTNRKGTGGLSIMIGSYSATGFDTNNVKKSRTAPYFDGSNARITYFRKILESKRWYSTASLGLSVFNQNLKLVDLSRQTIELDTLLKSPNLLPQLDYRRKSAEGLIDVSADVYFRTKWLKKVFSDFDIGLKFGYAKSIGALDEWVVYGTNNLYPGNFPKVRLDNFYFQMSFLCKYSFID